MEGAQQILWMISIFANGFGGPAHHTKSPHLVFSLCLWYMSPGQELASAWTLMSPLAFASLMICNR